MLIPKQSFGNPSSAYFGARGVGKGGGGDVIENEKKISRCIGAYSCAIMCCDVMRMLYKWGVT